MADLQEVGWGRSLGGIRLSNTRRAAEQTGGSQTVRCLRPAGSTSKSSHPQRPPSPTFALCAFPVSSKQP
eukprot:scaffold7997_cov126-Isochrysis_galbana.AAC.1